MKSLLPWLVTTLALAAAGVYYLANESKSETLATLQPQLQQLESLRGENAELKANQLSAEEMDRIRKNTDELVRLRNEVRQLRDTEKQLTQQVQAERAATQRAQEQAAAAKAQAQSSQTQVQTQLQALSSATNPVAQLTPEQQAFAARYGLSPVPAGQQANACLNNLRQLEGAKQQWALENQKREDAIPLSRDILPYLRNEPKCPAGGVYTLNAVSAHPVCSVQGHALPP